MATITFSIGELMSILDSDDLLPERITGFDIEDNKVWFRLNTGWPVPETIRVAVEYVDFENGTAILELSTNLLIDTFGRLIDRLLKSLDLPDYVSRVEYSKVYIDINNLLGEKVKGIRIENIILENGKFFVTTCDVVTNLPPD
ncbi:MAG TPA: hypothetical protein VMW16_02730 [Sedimentisphaerales bacterium]|nr:hypothetical protein [Sedimentisphaerales bacterium]